MLKDWLCTATAGVHAPLPGGHKEVSDQQLVVEMNKENTGRRDCSPYERGCQFKLVVDQGLFVSARKLAEVVGLDHSMVSKLLTLAELPRDVVKAFRTPDKLQVNWGATLRKALGEDEKGVLRRAAEVISVDFHLKVIH